MTLQYTIGWSNQPWDRYMGGCCRHRQVGIIGLGFHGICVLELVSTVFVHAGPKCMACSPTAAMHLQYLTKRLDFFILCIMCAHVYVCVWACMYHSMYVEIRGNLWELDLFFHMGMLKTNSGCQAWKLVPLPAEPCCWNLLSISVSISYFSVFQMIFR